MINDAKSYFKQLDEIMPAVPFPLIDRLADLIFQLRQSRKTIFVFGNGGSASLASHMACDLGKGTSTPDNGSRIRIVALTDNIPLITAWANDSSYADIFSEQLKNLATAGDLAIAISGSGNSPNVIEGLRTARQIGMRTVGIGGFDGGKMISLCDFSIIVPAHNMQMVEDLNVCIAHCVFTLVRNHMNGEVSLKAYGAAAGIAAGFEVV